MNTINNGEIEDLYLEHSQHNELMPSRCSECYNDDEQLTLEKRIEEAEQASASASEREMDESFTN